MGTTRNMHDNKYNEKFEYKNIFYISSVDSLI